MRTKILGLLTMALLAVPMAAVHADIVVITGVGLFESDFFVTASGENFFTITAINGQFISSISLLGLNGATFEDVRQVRLGGVPVPVPEPGTLALLGLGLTGLALSRGRWMGRAALMQRTAPTEERRHSRSTA